MTERIKIAGVPFDNLDYKGVLKQIDHFIKNDRKVYIVTANPEMILNASKDDKFFEVLAGATLNTPDGTGILWAATYLEKPRPKNALARRFQFYQSCLAGLFFPRSIRKVLKERVTGTDLMKKIVEMSQEKTWKIFLLGASSGIAKKVTKKFSKKHPNVKFVGCHAGTPHIKDEMEICELINEAKPDILFVAYGSPDQEFWIHRNLFKLNSVKVAMGVGGAFDFHAGRVKRAPKWMQKAGLEWLWRLTREPKRLSRIWNATVVFSKLVAKEKEENHSAQ